MKTNRNNIDEINKIYFDSSIEEFYSRVTEYNFFCEQVKAYFDEIKNQSDYDDNDEILKSPLLDLDFEIFEDQLRNTDITPDEYNYMVDWYSKKNNEKINEIIVLKLYDYINKIFDLVKKIIEILDKKINISKIYSDKYKLNIDKILSNLSEKHILNENNLEENNLDEKELKINWGIIIKKLLEFSEDYKSVRNNIEKELKKNISIHNNWIKKEKKIEQILDLLKVSFSEIEDNLYITNFIEKIEFNTVEDFIIIVRNYSEKIKKEQDLLGKIYSNNDSYYLEKIINSRLEVKIDIYRYNLISILNNVINKLKQWNSKEYKKYLIPHLLTYKWNLEINLEKYDFLNYNFPPLYWIIRALETIEKNKQIDHLINDINKINSLLEEINSLKNPKPTDDDFKELINIMKWSNNK